MKFKNTALFLCAKTTLGSARSIDYIRATLASCKDRDSSVKHVLYIGRIYWHWTGLLDSSLTRVGMVSCLLYIVLIMWIGWQAGLSHFACNDLVPTSYSNILAATVYLNIIKLAIE